MQKHAGVLAAIASCLLISLVVHGAADNGPDALDQQPEIMRLGKQADPYHPQFEFAPQAGTGMPASCTCTKPTGTRGEVMTFARASSGTCTKGNISALIANGDVVTCTSNQPRVMPGGDGTGVKGMLSEGARTNVTLRSQQFTDPVWIKDQNGVAAPIITADVATAPDGTLTADRLQVPATTGGQYSFYYQNPTCLGVGNSFFTLYVRGHGGTSGTLDMESQGGAAEVKFVCNYVGTSWTRCGMGVNTNTLVVVGSNAVYGPPMVGAAADVDIWGEQCEVGGFASSYIATLGASGTRAEDLGFFGGLTLVAGGSWSFFATATLPTVKDGDPFFAEVIFNDANNRYDLYRNGNVSFNMLVVANAVGQSGPSLGTLVPDTTMRVGGYYQSENLAGHQLEQFTCVAGSCSSLLRIYSPFTPNNVAIGNFLGGGDPAWAVVSQVCYDNSSTRCR